MNALSLSVSSPRSAKGRRLGDRLDSFHHQTLFAHRQGRAFGPAAVNVGQGQRMDEVPVFLHSCAVFDQITFKVAGRRIAPIGKGPYRYALFNRGVGAPATPARMSRRFPLWAQQSIDGGGADLQEPVSYHRGELEMAVALHRIDQHRDQYPKPLAADAIGRLPQHRQCLMHHLVVESPSRARALLCWRLIQHAQRVFTMIPGYADELGQDLPPL
jgi:hypothetical protein